MILPIPSGKVVQTSICWVDASGARLEESVVRVRLCTLLGGSENGSKAPYKTLALMSGVMRIANHLVSNKVARR